MFNFKKNQNNEIKALKKEQPNINTKEIISVVNDFNEVIDVQNGYFITKDKKVTFVFQLDNVDFDLLSTEQQDQHIQNFRTYISDFGNKQGFTKDILLNQYVFKVPFKLDEYESILKKHINNAGDLIKKRALDEEMDIIEKINYENAYQILSTFVTFTLPLKTIKNMYSNVCKSTLNGI